MPVAIVTGSDSGIGQATAVALAEAGCHVGVTYLHDRDGAKETADRVRDAGGRCEVRRMDLTRLPDEANVIDDLAGSLGGVDVLVNNAGTGHMAPFLEHSYDDWRRVLSVDLDGVFCCTQRAARRMVEAKSGGRIINVTSVHEHQPLLGSPAYCAAKAGVGLFTKTVALELASHGITVNAVAPGEVATPMTGQEDVDVRRQARPGYPIARPADAREIAAVVTFLASAQASYVTGVSWVVDGGMLQMGPTGCHNLPDDSWRQL